MTRLVLVHGTATGPAIWEPVLPHLTDFALDVPERPRTGDLGAELDWLAGIAEGAWIVGVSGGATLGLALASTGIRLAGAILHEPAVGRLVPELLAPVTEAFASGGTNAFARALYGDDWSPVPDAPWLDDEVTARELAMFRAFEPSAPQPTAGTVVSSLGARSAAPRVAAARALADQYGIETITVPGAGHLVPHDAPATFASIVRGVVTRD